MSVDDLCEEEYVCRNVGQSISNMLSDETNYHAEKYFRITGVCPAKL